MMVGTTEQKRRPGEAPLKILTHSLTLEPRGGVEICTVQDSRALVARGHEVALMWGSEGQLASEYADLGVELAGPYRFSFDASRPISSLRDFAPAMRRGRSERPDVVWLNRIEHLPWGQAVARWSGAPLVCHLHGPPVYRRMSLVGHGVAHFIAVSDFIREMYLDAGIDSTRITRVYNAIQDDDYPVGGVVERQRARQALKLPADSFIVLCYGQFTEPKGALVLLEAWRRVLLETPDAVLVLVDSGLGTLDADMKGALESLPTTSVRRFPMAADVVPFLHASDVVAFPTLLPEAFGRVALEGLATGRPVVASDVGAVPEIFSRSLSHLLFKLGAADELADRLVGLATWRETMPSLGTECARWARDHFPFVRHIDALEQILLEHRRAARSPRD